MTWTTRTAAAFADECAELGCACVPCREVRGVWVVQADDEQRDVINELRQEWKLPPLTWSRYDCLAAARRI